MPRTSSGFVNKNLQNHYKEKGVFAGYHRRYRGPKPTYATIRHRLPWYLSYWSSKNMREPGLEHLDTDISDPKMFREWYVAVNQKQDLYYRWMWNVYRNQPIEKWLRTEHIVEDFFNVFEFEPKVPFPQHVTDRPLPDEEYFAALQGLEGCK